MRRPEAVALPLVALAYVVVGAVVVPPSMYFEWDEGVYLSQFARHAPALYMSEPRAYGVPLLTAPVVMVTDSVIALRLYLGVLCGLGVWLAFLPWSRLRPGMTVPLAALLFTSLWVTLFYVGQAAPNMFTACSATAATGLFLRVAGGSGGRAHLAGLAAALAVMGMMRPTDALWVALPLCLAAVLRRSWRRPGLLAAIAAGGAAGWTPWVIEAQLRFGGLATRLERVDMINDVGWRFNAARLLALFGNGGYFCHFRVPDCGEVALGAVIAVVALCLLVVAGLCAHRSTADLMAAVMGTLVALPYLFYLGLAAPRFLLPSLALLAIPAATGLCWIATRHRIARLAVISLMAVHIAGQLSLASTVAEKTTHRREVVVRAVHRLELLGVRRPCFTEGWFGPPLAYALGCRALGDRSFRTLRPGDARVRRLLAGEAARGTRVAVVGRKRRPAFVPAGWRRVRVLRTPAVYAFLSDGHAAVPPAGERRHGMDGDG